jgi:hypothetical protein
LSTGLHDGLSGALSSQAEGLDEFPISVEVFLFQICEKPSTLSYELQQTRTRMKILFVHFEVLGQMVDPVRQKGYLDFRRSGVFFVPFVFIDHLIFFLYHDTAPPQ